MDTRRCSLRRWSAVLVAVVLLVSSLRADKPEALPDVSQETKTEIKFTVKAKDDKPRFRIVKVRKDDRDATVPKNMTLDADSGAFAWTPTPSQAGVYDVTFATAGGDDAPTVSAHITVKARPVSAANGPVGDLLRKWYGDGTAAGNTGDFYDNRDRDHSALNLAPYPQLDVITYTDEDRKGFRDWAGQHTLQKAVVFGNSSTSAPVLSSGSNVRSYYANPRGLAFLYEQYRGNNLYMYPAHHDHHPGHNGKPFYGDVYPTNTPYLITSQGSSGTDQPFMNAVPKTLAAFRPEVKKKLVETGLLMPTVQMILRSSNKHIKEPKEYLTGKAHPPVFEGSQVDEMKMVQMAHDIELKTIPPMIQLKVVEEDEPVGGKDMFDGPLGEKIGDTPAVIARVVRGSAQVRRMVVSAEDSFDANKSPLKFTWVVLRGDRERIQIKPLNESGSKVELLVPYHERRPVEDAPLKIESNRVDIGAFVNNGTYYSAPGFVTFFYPDNEARAYDDKGRLLERAFGYGETEVTVGDWKALFDLFKGENKSLGATVVRKPYKPEEVASIVRVGDLYALVSEAVDNRRDQHKRAAEARQKAAEAAKADPKDADLADALKKAEAAVQEAQKKVDEANKQLAEILERKVGDTGPSLKDSVERTLLQLRDDVSFATDHRTALDALLQTAEGGQKARVAAARKRLIDLGILSADGEHLTPIREGKAAVAERLTPFERSQVERFNGELLAALVYPKVVNANYKVNFVDQRLFTAKSWRDVYHYDSKGHALGWTRYDGDQRWDFSPAGEVILEKDELGRPRKSRTVKYELDDVKKNIFQSPVALKQGWGDEVLHYEYADDSDFVGKVAKREAAPK